MEPLLILTHLAIILLFGILFTMVARRLKIPHMLLLILCGMALGSLVYNGQPLIMFPPIFTNSIGVLALVLVVFDASSRFKWKEFDTLTLQATKITIAFLLFNILFLTIITSIMFRIENIYLALIFSSLMAGTSADVVLSIFMNRSNKVTNLLEVESIVNTPFTVLLPFIILTIMQRIMVQNLLLSDFLRQILSIFQQIVTGIGAGVLMGIVIFKIMRKYYSQRLSPLILITSTLLTYILAEQLNGSGVLAVTILGLFFGNFYVKQKQVLFEFSSIFGNSLMILVFVLVGLQIHLPFGNIGFFLASVILFVVYIGIRSMAVYVSTMNSDFTPREKIFITLNMPKGIAVTVIVFALLSYQFIGGTLGGFTFVSLPWGELVLNLTMTFMIFSLILSTIVNHFSRYFIKIGIE